MNKKKEKIDWNNIPITKKWKKKEKIYQEQKN